MFSPKNILVPTDFSALADGAMCYAENVARTNKSTIHIVHVPELILYPWGWEYPGSLELENRESSIAESVGLKKQAQNLQKKGLNVVTKILATIGTADSIAAYAAHNNIDLICIATHGLSGFKRFFLGSTTEHLLRIVRCPVLVIHRDDVKERREDLHVEEAHSL